MKKTTGILVGLLLLGGLSWVLLRWMNQGNEPLLPFPGETEVIVGLDVTALTKIVLQDYLFHQAAYAPLQEWLTQSRQVPPLFESPLETGLRLKGTYWVYGFRYPQDAPKRCWALAMKIDKAADFVAWADSLSQRFSLQRDTLRGTNWLYSSEHQTGLIWAGKTALWVKGLGGPDFPAQAFRLLHLRGNETLSPKLPGLAQLQTEIKNKALVSWSRSGSPDPQAWQTFVQSLDFTAGQIQQEVFLYPDLNYAGPLLQSSPKTTPIEGPLSLQTAFAPEWIARVQGEDWQSLFPGPLEAMLPAFRAWNGSLSLVIQGWETIAQSYTTYEFDDNFNRIAVQKQKESLLPVLQLEMEMYDSLRLANQMQQWQETGLLHLQADRWILEPDSGYTFYLQQRATVLRLSSEEGPKSPADTLRAQANCLDLEVDLVALAQALPKEHTDGRWIEELAQQWSGFSLILYPEGRCIRGQGSLRARDTERNALPQLLLWGLARIPATI